jgi:hypothetical protein
LRLSEPPIVATLGVHDLQRHRQILVSRRDGEIPYFAKLASRLMSRPEHLRWNLLTFIRNKVSVAVLACRVNRDVAGIKATVVVAISIGFTGIEDAVEIAIEEARLELEVQALGIRYVVCVAVGQRGLANIGNQVDVPIVSVYRSPL